MGTLRHLDFVSGMPVHFFVKPAGISLERAQTLDPDRDWTDLRRAREVWIIQTWHRLRHAGYTPTMSDEPVNDGIIVYHKEDQRELLRRLPRQSRAVLVGVRADFRSCDAADFEVLQNGYYADQRRSFFVPHWPQPGLIPRDKQRGDRLERIAFKGYAGNLLAEFRLGQWQDFLATQGLIFDDDAIMDDSSDHPILTRFHDYHDVDVVLAVRPGQSTHKPASKLVNAWHAGVPALLSPDYPFEELRQSPDDYLAVSSVTEAIAAVNRLLREPGLYRRMIEQGFKRAQHYTVASVTQQWAKLLYQTIPAQVSRRPQWTWSPIWRGARTFRRKAAQSLGLISRR